MPESSRARRHRRRLFRHRLHMYAYAGVSFALMTMGFVFSGFAIFKRDSEISKIWLAGPTTIAVGLVLCGKVIIDCRPREATDEGDILGQDEEHTDIECTTLEKEMVAKVETTHTYDMAKEDSLIIENFALGKKIIYNHNAPNFRRQSSYLESDIWNLRDDCSSLASLCSPRCPHYRRQTYSLCLQNSSARDTSDSVEKAPSRAQYAQLHSYSVDPEAAATFPCHSQTMHSSSPCTPLSNDHKGTADPASEPLTTPRSRRSRCIDDDDDRLDSASSLYQGETFLLNDKQYFI